MLAVAVIGDCFDLGLELRDLLSVVYAVAMMVGGWCNGCCTHQERCGVTGFQLLSANSRDVAASRGLNCCCEQ